MDIVGLKYLYKNKYNMSDLTEKEKFKYETIRMFVITILGFIATVFIVQPWESNTKYSAFLEKEKILIKKEVVDDFLKTSYLYASSMYKVMSHDTGLNKQIEIELYESNYRKYRVNLNRIILYFKIEKLSKHNSLVKKSNDLRYKLRQMYLDKNNKKDWNKLRNKFKSTNNEIAKLALRAIGL